MSSPSSAAQNLTARIVPLLERWAGAMEDFWTPVPGEPGLGFYGLGYVHWGVQANWNYLATLATLAAQPGVANREHWRQRAVAAFRYALATHRTGTRPGSDGKPWGSHWISMLGLERAMHGIPCLAPSLSPADLLAFRRLLISEVDWLLSDPSRDGHSGICAGKWGSSGRNNPESNIWSGCILWRIASLYPDAPNAAAWRERAQEFLVNGVSIDADAQDQTLLAGRTVAERHKGANFFPHYALDHHGYLNVGYMVICTSNAAMLHFDLKRAGLDLPPTLYHHQGDLWQVLRRMLFADGRLARIGGDSRVRYSYCQEYLLPSLLLAADQFGDGHALELASRQLALIEQESAAGGDGSFYGRRLAAMRHSNPHYYTRLESDRACVLAMLLNYLPLVTPPPAAPAAFESSVAGPWCEPEHVAAMQRSPARFASFAWRSHGLTQGLCLPPQDSSLAEWSANLAPVVRFLGDDPRQPGKYRRLVAAQVAEFPGGFVTSGSVREGVDVGIDEAAGCTDQALTRLAFAALPDDRSCLVLQQVVAAPDRFPCLIELKSLHLVLPNDLFNGNCRRFAFAGGNLELCSPPARPEVREAPGPWLNVDGRLGVVSLAGGQRFLIDRSPERRAGRYRSLFTEEICLHALNGVRRCQPGEMLVDVGFAVLAGADAEATAKVGGGALSFAAPGLRGVWITGADGRRYALVANFGTEPATAEVFGQSLTLAPGSAAVRQDAPGA